ncbi:MAG TPA: hypothetical protein VF503_33285 [Sphingobium sp.]|uniref:hypothetical protein n=1 Tax=Sphingobium sp. TaxID=1912891 RepID=UPI002ED0F8D1
MLAVEYDEATGIVLTTAQGLSSKEEFDRYVPVLTRLIGRSLARHGRFLHLVDSQDSPVQSRESSDHVSETWNAKARDDGRTAYVVHSVLKKMQIQHMRDDDNHRFFPDVPSARVWLLEEGGAGHLLLRD